MARWIAALLTCSAMLAAPFTRAEPAPDVQKAPSCPYCGMDRDKFGHSRMVVEYEDGKAVGTCSLHCAAIELAVSIDGAPRSLKIADMKSRQLVDAEAATWVIGGAKPGVMTKRAKWAFAERAAAEAFAKENGGEVATFEQALQAAYQDMYEDVRMIRERRKAKRAKAAEEARH